MPLPTFTNKTDLVDIIYAADVNDLQNEVAPTAAASAHVRYSTAYTSTGNVVLTDASMPVQSINFSSNSSITLPAISTSNHPFYLINRSTASVAAVIFSGSTITSISAASASVVYSDSTASWMALSAGAASGVTADSTTTFTNKSISLTTNTLTGTSLQLKTAISDETGSGALVFGTAPTLSAPVIADFSSAGHNHQSTTTGGNLYPFDGVMQNGKLSVTVAANDLIVAIKTLAGTDPSATNPAYVRINGTVRTISAATSITLADATNWFNAGSSELATIAIDYFAYAVWDSNSSVVAISCARIPYGRLVSEFNSTSTDERYLGNYANFTTTDDVVVIGRFEATLSAGAGYTWTVPTFTSSNLINYPIYETRWLSWTPTRTGFSANPTNTVYNYKIDSDTCYIIGRDGADGTSNANTNQLTLPIGATQTTNVAYQFVAAGTNSGASLSTPSYGFVTTASWSTLIFGLDMTANSTAWGTSLGKRIRTVTGFYKVA